MGIAKFKTTKNTYVIELNNVFAQKLTHGSSPYPTSVLSEVLSRQKAQHLVLKTSL